MIISHLVQCSFTVFSDADYVDIDFFLKDQRKQRKSLKYTMTETIISV